MCHSAPNHKPNLQFASHFTLLIPCSYCWRGLCFHTTVHWIEGEHLTPVVLDRLSHACRWDYSNRLPLPYVTMKASPDASGAELVAKNTTCQQGNKCIHCLWPAIIFNCFLKLSYLLGTCCNALVSEQVITASWFFRGKKGILMKMPHLIRKFNNIQSWLFQLRY